MAKEVLIEIRLDNQDAFTQMQRTQKEIDKLVASQKELKKTGAQNSKQFQQNATNLKKLRSEQSKLRTEVIKQDAAQKANIKTLGGISAKLADMRQKIRGVEIGTPVFNRMAKEIRSLEKAQRDFNQQLGRGRTFVGEYGAIFRQFAGAAGIGVGVAGIVRATKEIANLAVELDTLQRKSAIVFGEYLEQVEDVGRTTAASLGLTTTEFVNAAASAADLLIPIGFTRQRAADLSTELVSLSGALGQVVISRLKRLQTY
jgi:uncharacterized phage infection (PIP) family protein YhgE